MSSLASPETAISPRSLPSTPRSADASPRTPPAMQPAAAPPNIFSRRPNRRLTQDGGLALLLPRERRASGDGAPARPTSAGRRLPLMQQAAAIRQVARTLDFTRIEQELDRSLARSAVPRMNRRTDLTLDLSLLDGHAGSPPEHAFRYGSNDSTPTTSVHSRNPSTGTLPAGISRQPSTESWPRTPDSGAFDATQIWIHDRHDAARHLIDARCEDAVHALLAVLVDVLTRTKTPAPPKPGNHTPLSKHKVDNLDPALLDKVPALALARRLKTILDSGASGLALFDGYASAAQPGQDVRAARFRDIQALTDALLSDMLRETSLPLLAMLGGEQWARDNFIKVIAENVERIIETRDIPKDPRYLAIATRLQEASYDLCDLEPQSHAGPHDEDPRRKARTALTQRAISALP